MFHVLWCLVYVFPDHDNTNRGVKEKFWQMTYSYEHGHVIIDSIFKTLKEGVS